MSVNVEANDTNWKVSWRPVAGAISYKVSRSFVNAEGQVRHLVLTTRSTSITIKTDKNQVKKMLGRRQLPEGVGEFFRVRALGRNATVLASGGSLSCPTLAVVGVRGSGERKNWASNELPVTMGSRAEETWLNLLGTLKVGQSRISAMGVVYTAIGMSFAELPNVLVNYGNSVANGVSQLSSAIDFAHSQCPNTRYILVGYSQGADVVGDWYQSQPRHFAQIAQTVLVADPQRNGSDAPVMYPSVNRSSSMNTNGVHPSIRPAFQVNEQKIVSSWCWVGDDVCNSNTKDGTNWHDGKRGNPYEKCYQQSIRWTIINGLQYANIWPRTSNPSPPRIPSWCLERARN